MQKALQIDYLAGYPAALAEQVRRLLNAGRLGDVLLNKYPHAHTVRSDKALYDYVQQIKTECLSNAGPLDKVAYDNKMQAAQQVLGTNARVSRVQGSKLKSKHEIRVASVFRMMPLAFLRMIVVHELAHLRERAHDKAFYKLCQHMESDYFQLEFDLRAYLLHLDATGKALWGADD